MYDLPWACAVEGVPASVQGSATKRNAWKAKVYAAAKIGWPHEPLDINVQVGVTFFHLGDAPDVDNILKHTIDGLIGVVVLDDKQVTDVRGSLRGIELEYILTGINIDLAANLEAGAPFVQIKVEHSPDFQELP